MLNDIGGFLRYRGSEDAADHFEQAIRFTATSLIARFGRDAQQPRDSGWIPLRPQTAIDSFTEALQLYMQLRIARNWRASDGLGAVDVDLGTSGRTRLVARVTSRRREVEDSHREADTLHHLGVFEYGLGRISEALEWFAQALPSWRLQATGSVKRQR